MTSDRAVIRAEPNRIVRDWTFTSSPPSWRTRMRRIESRLHRRSGPSHELMRAPFPSARWNGLFIFAPKGFLDHDQLQILSRMRDLPGRLIVAVASDTVPTEIERVADALIRKDLRGFDFSGYALMLDALARYAPGTFAYVQNDSVLGPFASLEDNLDRMTWNFGGFLGSAAVENHLSSFAFALRDVTARNVAALAPALTTQFAFDHHQHVVTMQETRLARTAARAMSVGALWFMPDPPAPPAWPVRLRMAIGSPPDMLPIDLTADLALSMPLTLMDQGFPFMKRSLFGKFAGVADQNALRARLTWEGWTIAPDQVG